MILTLNIYDQDGASLLIDSGGISINGDTNNSQSSTHNLTVDDGSEVDIIVSQSGYRDYSINIDNVYTEDKTISIFLGQELDISAPEYNRPTPRFFTFLDPCSFRVDYYKASSTFGDTSWYINNNLYDDGYKGSFKTVGPASFQLKIRETVSSDVELWDKQFATIETGNTVISSIDPIADYLDDDLTENVSTEEYRPEFNLSLSSPSTLELNGDNCYVRDETLTITPEVEIKKGVTSDYSVTIVATNPLGLEVINATFSLDILEPVTFKLTQLGSYDITCTVTHLDCNNTFTITKQIETCNFVDIKYKDCNLFTVNNRSSSKNINVQVTDIEYKEVYPKTEIAFNQSLDIPIPDVSIYIFNVTYDGVVNNETVTIEEQYFVTNYCQIEDCLSGYIEQNLCGNTSLGDPVSASDCNPCPDEVELNQMLLLQYTLFMKLNKLYAFNNFYSGLEDSDIAQVTSIKNIADKLVEFCKRRGCINSSTSAFKQGVKSSYDWSSNNKDCNCS